MNKLNWLIAIFLFFSLIANAKLKVLGDYRGWKNCIQLYNANTKVILAPQSGGRVLYYSLNDQNIFFEDKEFESYLLNDFRKDRRWPDGGRFDIGPESISGKLRDELFMGEWDYTILNDNAVELFLLKIIISDFM